MGVGEDIRPGYADIADWIARTDLADLHRKCEEASVILRRIGVTFAVYGEQTDAERLIPFDLIPRVFTAPEWQRIEAGVMQRSRALNAFIRDVYHDAEIVRAGKVPDRLVSKNDVFLAAMKGFSPPLDIYAHIIGTDLVRTGPDEFYVLEDNCRTPSGISYVLENRELMMRLFPEFFQGGRIAPVDGYPDLLQLTMEEVKPPACTGVPTLAILTPGPFNSAYYEHSFLADQMGISLVQGDDLFVENGKVWMRTTRGAERVDVIYRRIDDDFLDPLAFRPDSALGVPGLMRAYLDGNVTLLNAPGSGVADDKATYCYVPEMIRFYLGEEPILPNVPTYQCGDADQYAHVRDNLQDLVVKEVHGSGGYGMLVGPKATADERTSYLQRMESSPGSFVAQPTLALSTSPTLVEEGVAPRHIDFRPFALSGQTVRVTPGGLTRVALPEGSLVVNSSQGGGVKDTWVLRY
ncbi:MAG: circularly permuted type 2 ATP-grasp protein [Pseudomonadota bacterium]